MRELIHTHSHIHTLPVVILKFIIWDWSSKAQFTPTLIARWFGIILTDAPLKEEGNLQIDLFNFYRILLF